MITKLGIEPHQSDFLFQVVSLNQGRNWKAGTAYIIQLEYIVKLLWSNLEGDFTCKHSNYRTKNS